MSDMHTPKRTDSTQDPMPVHERQELPQHVVALALDWPEQRKYLKLETRIAQLERYYPAKYMPEEYAEKLEERARYVRKARKRIRVQALMDDLARHEQQDEEVA